MLVSARQNAVIAVAFLVKIGDRDRTTPQKSIVSSLLNYANASAVCRFVVKNVVRLRSNTVTR